MEEVGDVYKHFAKTLADNEKEVRDRALLALKRFVSKAQLTDLDLAKLWRGLFFCMWHSDKPLVQHELAKSMAQLVHDFKEVEDGVRFFKAFLQTMCKRWGSIDEHRMDKYLTLVRRFFEEAFLLSARRDWDVQVAKQISEALSLVVFKGGDADTNLTAGFPMHCVWVYLDSIEYAALTADQEKNPALVTPAPAAAATEEAKKKETAEKGKEEDEKKPKRRVKAPSATVLELLEPLIGYVARGTHPLAIEKISREVLNVLAGPPGIREHIDRDHEAIAKRIFEHAASKDTREENRTSVYDTHKRFLAEVKRAGKKMQPDKRNPELLCAEIEQQRAELAQHVANKKMMRRTGKLPPAAIRAKRLRTKKRIVALKRSKV